MKTKTLPATAFIALAALFAADTARASECRPVGSAERVNKFTNYSPIARGINGRCGRSASGWDACKYFLEDYMKSSAPAVMGAVPQRGGTSHLYGGVYRAVALERAIGTRDCIKVVAGDRYGTSSNNKSKMDIVTRQSRSTMTAKVNAAKGEMIPLGRMPRIRPTQRQINRNPAAILGNVSPGRAAVSQANNTPNRQITRQPASLNRMPVPAERPAGNQVQLPKTVPVPVFRPREEEDIQEPIPERFGNTHQLPATVRIPSRDPASLPGNPPLTNPDRTKEAEPAIEGDNAPGVGFTRFSSSSEDAMP